MANRLSLPDYPLMWQQPDERWSVEETAVRCPSCGQLLVRSGSRNEQVVDLPRGNQPQHLEIHVQRWRCKTKGCRGVSAHDPLNGLRATLPHRERRAMVTQRLYDALIDKHFQGEQVTSLAEWSGIHPRTLWRWLEPERLARVRGVREVQHWRNLNCIGIDELFWRNRILCVIINLDTGELLDLLPDRGVETVVASLKDISNIVTTLTEAAWEPVLVTDMWDDYRLAIKEAFQDHAIHITDRFHFQSKISEDLTNCLREILPASRQRPRYIRLARSAFHAGETSGVWLNELDPKHRHQVSVAIQLATQIKCVWDCPDEAIARQTYALWRWDVATSELPKQPYGRLIHLFERWDEQIFGYFRPLPWLSPEKRVTGARSESVNSRLRTLERRSQRHTFNHFKPNDQHSAQQQFESIWVAAMHMLNTPTGDRPATLTGAMRPAFTACPACESAAITVEWRQTRKSVQDVPWGEIPVKYVWDEAIWNCSACQQRGIQGSEDDMRYTPALVEYVGRKRLSGWSIRKVAQVTGLSRQLVKELTPTVENTLSVAPSVLGIQVWRWRRANYWVLTDVERGLLVDILPVERGRLGTLLESTWGANISTVVLAHPDWSTGVPLGMKIIIDRFTATLPVQRALQEVQRRFTDTVSVAARRQPAYHRHRHVILTSPDGLSAEDRQRLDAWVIFAPELRVARELRDQFHRCFEATDSHESGLRAWLASAQRRTRIPVSSPIQRALHFGFRDACHSVSTAFPMIVAGMQSPVHNLAASRILLRHLREHSASRQPDFALLRHAVLQAFGKPQ